ncbi:putative ABC transporter ATP-binding protein YknV [Paenibacillus montaniterrae]|uniref:ABC transporter ATP-binding protein YknV n=1 Tax=Paenibacillus montaniterrae TaxID=429341 RepID=A0A919YQF2_9BACL|nr:ABC transporter ATP-binding protein [Paenibacillus montaniterrae]GIP15063.1 putative ABC transporter ATP-binding protein YknV [Paenibacillus montaniterrae]
MANKATADRAVKRDRFVYTDDDVIEKSFNWEQMRRLYTYMKPHNRELIPVLIVMVIGTLTRLGVPLLIYYAIDHIILPDTGSGNTTHLWLLAALMLGMYVVQMIATHFRIKQTNIIGQKVLLSIRSHIFTHIQKLSFRFFDKRPAGSVLVRVTNDVNALQDLFTNGVVNLLMDIIQLIGIIVILLVMNFKLGLAVMVTVPIMFFVSTSLRKKIRFAWQEVRMKNSRINSHLNESIQGMKVTQAYVQEKNNIEFFRQMNESNLKSWNRASALNQSFGPIIEVTAAIGTCILYWYGTHLIKNDAFTVGLLVAYSTYMAHFWDPINRLGQLYSQLLIAMASSERIFEFIDEQPTVSEKEDAKPLPQIQGSVRFENIVFEYEKDRPALKNISIDVKEGQSIALVGHTGSGKSTIINLLCRFYDPVEGRVLIDGIDIRDITLESLRKQVGLVMQDTFIFSGTIRDNIRYGKLDATHDEIVRVAKAVNAHDFIMSLPDGYDTQVEERGNMLSMGQRQLLSFARALLSNPKILILDEATASIDTDTELKIQEALKVLLKGRTSFMIAHRLSTIRNADDIIVLDHGRIVEQGNHEQLMAQKGVYHGLIQAQYRFV